MTSQNNNENWSHVRETVLLINVAVARIEHAMLEGNDSFTALSDAFVTIAEASNQIQHETQKLDASPTNEKIAANSQDISARVSNTIVDFQFYDRLSQRMALISQTLNSLTDMLKDPKKTNTKTEWINLQDTIRAKYTLDSDQEMFDAVLKGASIKDALKIAVTKTEEENVVFF